METDKFVKWQRELKGFLGIKSGIILEGNISDVFYFADDENDEEGFDNLDRVLHTYAMEKKAEIIYYNPIQGFYCYCPEGVEVGEYSMSYLSPYLDGYVCEKKLLKQDEFAYMPVKEKIDKEIGSKSKKIQLLEGKDNERKDDIVDDKLQQVRMSQIVRRAMINQEIRYDECTGEVVKRNSHPNKVFVLNLASRLESCNLDDTAKTEMFLNLQNAINDVSETTGMRNTIIFVVDKYNDIPAWLFLNNPNIRTFNIERPGMKTRRLCLSYILESARYDDYQLLNCEESIEARKFVTETNGLLCKELNQIIDLALNENIKCNEIEKAIKMYKYGLKESPWEELGVEKIYELDRKFSERVKGQAEAINLVKRVVMRAIKGLSGLQHSSADSKPRGVLFFAGPTGVGKTETAKTIAETIFGDEDACIRFDMSEYRAEHSDQKLFGAPPGYVGYEGGGQLTNAVKNHPFSVLLFDEIEKAHPSIMDKFLQILEDGRMTDNQGNTVYFSESIIIFTSNLGLTRLAYDETGNPIYDGNGNPLRIPTITIKNPFEEDAPEFKDETINIVKDGVKNYFVNIGRPELLNRLGENNIVVFNFIDKKVAQEICEAQVIKVSNSVQDRLNIQINTEEIQEFLNQEAISLRENGGRGIGNMIEERLINPLAEFICSYTDDFSRIKCIVSEDKKITFGGE
ncbi:MAG: AAA family ATPase [Lachnospiraceae bacterium]